MLGGLKERGVGGISCFVGTRSGSGWDETVERLGLCVRERKMEVEIWMVGDI